MMKRRRGIFILLSDLLTTKTSTTKSLRNKKTNITLMSSSTMRPMSPLSHPKLDSKIRIVRIYNSREATAPEKATI